MLELLRKKAYQNSILLLLIIALLFVPACTCTVVDDKWIVNNECFGDLYPCSDSSYDIGAFDNEWATGYFDVIGATGDVFVGNDLTVNNDVNVGGDLTVTGDLDALHADTHQWDYLQTGLPVRFGLDEVDIKDSVHQQLTVFRVSDLADATGWTFSAMGGGSGSMFMTYGITNINTGVVVNSRTGFAAAGPFYFDEDDSVFHHRLAGRVIPNTSTGQSDFWFGSFVWPNVYPTTNSFHVGWRVLNNTDNNNNNADLYATNGNGNPAGTQTLVAAGIGQFSILDLYWKYTDEGIRFYYNGNLVATHTTNIPDDRSLYTGFWIENLLAQNTRYQLYGILENMGPE